MTQTRAFQKAVRMAAIGIVLGVISAHAAENVVRCSGVNSFVKFGATDALQIPNNAPLTVEGWMKLYALDTRDMLYSKNLARTAAEYTYLFGFKDPVGARMGAYTGSAWQEVTVAITTGRWYHLAFSFDGTTMSYYLDGVLKGTTPFSFVNKPANASQIGGYMPEAGDINGCVSDVRLWNVARSQTQIQAAMSNRLQGSEAGLAAYWPLWEGNGLGVDDLSGKGSTGQLWNAAWEADDDLVFLDPSGAFKNSANMTLAQPETGSTRFTNTNRLNVASFPTPPGCNVYQVTTNADVSSINAGSWVSTAAPPNQLVLEQPPSDAKIAIYAWFTNSSKSVVLCRSKGEIFYTTTAPAPSVNPSMQRERMDDSDVIVYASDLDAGSTGGEANGKSMGVHKSVAVCSSDLTPNEPYVTLNDYGVFPMQLAVWNEAGNALTSSASCNVSVMPFSGSNLWVGLGVTNLWDCGLNWSAGVPVAGQTAWIGPGATAQLTQATAAMGSFTLCTGSMLRVSGWTSSLEAAEMTVHGLIRHASNTLATTDMDGNWTPLHRIWIRASNLIISTTGILDGDHRGYPAGAGPATPPLGGGYGSGGGGGHGGNSGSGYDCQAPAPEWGEPSDPWQLGSGGGNHDFILMCQSGGGAIRVDATGLVTVNGLVSVKGRSGSGTHGTAGAGGSIAIRCRTFQGASTGLLRADAGQGNYYGGNGGGGRIAVHYNSAAQAPLPRPMTKFSAYAFPVNNRGESFTVRASMGTLYLTDTRFLASEPDGDVGVDGRQFWHVRLYIGSNPQSWSPASVCLTNCVIGFPPGFDLDVAKDLVLYAHTNISPRLTGPVQAGLYLYTTATDDQFGGWLNVGRDMILSSNAWICPFTSGSNSAIIKMSIGRNLVVSNGGGIDADEKGRLPTASNANGPGSGRNNSSGGGHGGLGGGSAGGYVNGFANMPLNAGSPGGFYGRGSYTSSGRGGGAIYLVAGGDLLLNGTFTANGGNGNYYGGSAGSGGGIFIRGRRLMGSGLFRAEGGTKDTQHSQGDGGGGRIALWENIPDFLAARLAADEFHASVFVTNTCDGMKFKVEPGSGMAPGSPLAAWPGTVRILYFAPLGTVISCD